VKRVLILLDLDFVVGWSRELKAINDCKEAGRYRYPESFIKLLAVVMFEFYTKTAFACNSWLKDNQL
jgi:hypothetical protein